MKKGLFVLVIVAVCISASSVFAEQRIAVVNMKRIMEVSPEVDSVEKFVDKQEMEFESERDAMMEKRRKLVGEFEEAKNEARNQALSEKGKSEKIATAEEKLAELQDYQEKIQSILRERRSQLREQKVRAHRQMIAKLREKIGEYAGKKGYELVVNASGLGVDGIEVLVYSDSRLDITDEVIKNVIEAGAGKSVEDSEDKSE